MKINSENKNIDALIIGYLDDQLSNDEMQLFYDWINESPEHKAYFREIREIHLNLRKETFDAESSWRRFNFKLQKQKHHQRKTWIYRCAVAASIMTAILILTFTLDIPNKQPKQFVFNTTSSSTILNMPDGSMIKLGANSTLTYDEDYDVDNRNVTLKGEAFFIVAKNGKNSFTVTSDNNQITVTGTKFNVNSYSKDYFYATLVEGSIIYTNKLTKTPIDMTPGDELSYNNKKHKAIMRRVDVSDNDYMDDKYRFPSESMAAILEKMGHVYGVTFTCDKEEILNKKYRGIFYNGESINNFLEVIHSLTGMEYQIVNDSTIVLN